MTYFTTTVEHLFDVESFLKTSGAQYQHHLLDDKNVLLRITNFNPTMLDEKLFQKWGELYWMSRKINFTNESDLKSFIEKTTVPVEGAQIFKKEYLDYKKTVPFIIPKSKDIVYILTKKWQK